MVRDGGDFGGEVDVAAVECVEQAAERALVVVDQPPLHSPLGGVTEYVQRTAAQAPQPGQQPERGKHPRAVFLLHKFALGVAFGARKSTRLYSSSLMHI